MRGAALPRSGVLLRVHEPERVRGRKEGRESGVMILGSVPSPGCFRMRSEHYFLGAWWDAVIDRCPEVVRDLQPPRAVHLGRVPLRYRLDGRRLLAHRLPRELHEHSHLPQLKNSSRNSFRREPTLAGAKQCVSAGFGSGFLCTPGTQWHAFRYSVRNLYSRGGAGTATRRRTATPTPATRRSSSSRRRRRKSQRALPLAVAIQAGRY